MGLQIKQNKTMSQQKKADIMFCIDNSSSMQDCINGVRDTVNSFVTTLEEGVQGQSPVDWEIGLLTYSNYEFRFVNLSRGTGDFKKAIDRKVKGDEFTPGAIDFVISQANWREGAQRVIVVFTDEKLEYGRSKANAGNGAKGYDKLLKKIVDSYVQIIFYGPNCPYYNRFQVCPKSEVNIVSSFSGISFDELMKRLAVTVSSGNAFAGKEPVIKDLVYDLSDIHIIED